MIYVKKNISKSKDTVFGQVDFIHKNIGKLGFGKILGKICGLLGEKEKILYSYAFLVIQLNIILNYQKNKKNCG